MITTIAGGGKATIGDGKPATSAALFVPEGVAVDGQGNVYIADSATQRVRKVSASGTITTFAGGGSSLGDGGQATSAQLKTPFGVAVDRMGNVYISDSVDHRVRRVSPSGTIRTIAGTGQPGFSGDGGPATSARLSDPRGVAVDRGGNVYIADLLGGRVRKVSPGGTITTFAPGLRLPQGVAVDRKGNVFIASAAHVVLKVSRRGAITRFAGTGDAFGPVGDGGRAVAASLYSPRGVAVDNNGSVYIADTGNNLVRKVSGGGTIRTIAGNRRVGFSGDGGPATSAQLYGPDGVAVDAKGNIYIADTLNRRVRKVG